MLNKEKLGLQVWHVGRGIQGFTIATLGIQGIHRFSVFDQKNNMFWRDSGIQRRDSGIQRDSGIHTRDSGIHEQGFRDSSFFNSSACFRDSRDSGI